jgi:oxygen-independent coproporphyrinogen-3 oxidase
MSAPLHVPRELLTKYATSAPRYTSYPTAVDWSPDFDPNRYPELLERAASSNEPLSVYVHLPFCAELCLFCGCNVIISRSKKRMRTYVDALESEFAFVAARGVGARRVRQYHWGGGTPTQMSIAELERVQAAFHRAFTLDADAEVAVEVDPRVTTKEQVAWLAENGFNRVSLGVQDFEPEVQEAIKREQSEAQTRAVIDAARAAGIPSINIDLIYGLPFQTIASFARTIERVIAIRPERIALFHYAHVPWLKKHQKAIATDNAPSSEDKLTIFTRAIEQFQAAGYVYIGLDHFALPTDELARAAREGRLDRNFMGYTVKPASTMVAFGVSGIGEVEGAFFQNERKLSTYKQALDRGELPIQRGYALDADDRVRQFVIRQLMCNFAVAKPEVAERFGVDFDAYFAGPLGSLDEERAAGFVEESSDRLAVTPAGRMFVRNVCMAFDRYLAATREASRPVFSRTV